MHQLEVQEGSPVAEMAPTSSKRKRGTDSQQRNSRLKRPRFIGQEDLNMTSNKATRKAPSAEGLARNRRTRTVKSTLDARQPGAKSGCLLSGLEESQSAAVREEQEKKVGRCQPSAAVREARTTTQSYGSAHDRHWECTVDDAGLSGKGAGLRRSARIAEKMHRKCS